MPDEQEDEADDDGPADRDEHGLASRIDTQRNGEGGSRAQRGDEIGILIGDLAAHQQRRHAIGDLHHGKRHDEGRNADDGHAEGRDKAEGEAPQQA